MSSRLGSCRARGAVLNFPHIPHVGPQVVRRPCSVDEGPCHKHPHEEHGCTDLVSIFVQGCTLEESGYCRASDDKGYAEVNCPPPPLLKSRGWAMPCLICRYSGHVLGKELGEPFSRLMGQIPKRDLLVSSDQYKGQAFHNLNDLGRTEDAGQERNPPYTNLSPTHINSVREKAGVQPKRTDRNNEVLGLDRWLKQIDHSSRTTYGHDHAEAERVTDGDYIICRHIDTTGWKR